MANKRAPFPHKVEYTKAFCKDWERLSRRGRYDMAQLKEAVLLLIATDAPLGPEWKDHSLKANSGDTIPKRRAICEFYIVSPELCRVPGIVPSFI